MTAEPAEGDGSFVLLVGTEKGLFRVYPGSGTGRRLLAPSVPATALRQAF